jgi:hypothetical protein
MLLQAVTRPALSVREIFMGECDTMDMAQVLGSVDIDGIFRRSGSLTGF